MFWFAAICFALVYVTNVVLALMQSRNYTTAYTTLRRRGRVAIGKKKGLLTTGAIVMFLLDDNGAIVEGTRLTGVTVLARFRPFPEFDGQRLAEIAAMKDRRFTRSVRLAVDNARDNYLSWVSGQTPPEPGGPLSQIADGLRRLVGRPPKTPPVSLVLAEAAASGATEPAVPGTQRIRIPQPR
ncbi:transcriptional regulator GutM [Propionicimonas sp.]|uniref:transcriptional regulator GutM n=1 Tax=Propionicimonas sp. TaxID=1955623 RepID=UPI0039E68C9A